MKHLALIALGAVLVSGPAFAQAAPNTGGWLKEEKAGQWRASKLRGLNVYNNANEKVGDINEILVDKDGKIDAVVIGVGGFLGMGERDVAVPFKELKWVDEPRGTTASTAANPPATANPPAGAPANPRPATAPASRADAARAYPDHAQLNMTKDQLKAAPEFKYAR